jgi:hypothetical protein
MRPTLAGRRAFRLGVWLGFRTRTAATNTALRAPPRTKRVFEVAQALNRASRVALPATGQIPTPCRSYRQRRFRHTRAVTSGSVDFSSPVSARTNGCRNAQCWIDKLMSIRFHATHLS